MVGPPTLPRRTLTTGKLDRDDRYCRAGDDQEGLVERPGDPLVPRVWGLLDPDRGADADARARRPQRGHRVRVRDRLLVSLPLLHGDLRDPLDPRAGADVGYRDRR